MIHGNLIHLTMNMWEDREDLLRSGKFHRGYTPYMEFSNTTWEQARNRMRDNGMNMVVWDLGDGILYNSHPEIAVQGAWSRARLQNELAKCREAGLEVIPKLNFSTSHDTWLKEYSRMVSTPEYYQVCRDLIEEVVELFGNPRFFHIGMDEEDAVSQKLYRYVVIRQGTLWWDDFNFYVQCVEKCGCAAWCWSDKLWSCGCEEFELNMPKSVIQSNWDYYKNFNLDSSNTHQREIQAFIDLERMGYKQIPAGSNIAEADNYPLLVEFCKKNIAPENLIGFLMTPWREMSEKWANFQMAAVDIAAPGNYPR